jgi:dephospho-CoA kinase
MGGEVPSGGLLVLLGGGIGAGKSSVGALFADRGFTVVEADIIGHEVLAGDGDVRSAIGRRWPDVIVDGVVDRPRLAAIVFADGAELERLEAITHPKIIASIADRIAAIGRAPMVVETPLPGLELPGRGTVRIAVLADEDLRLARAVLRGGDPEDIKRRMASQADDAEWAAWADEVIDNSGPWAETERAVSAVIDALVADA